MASVAIVASIALISMSALSTGPTISDGITTLYSKNLKDSYLSNSPFDGRHLFAQTNRSKSTKSTNPIVPYQQPLHLIKMASIPYE